MYYSDHPSTCSVRFIENIRALLSCSLKTLGVTMSFCFLIMMFLCMVSIFILSTYSGEIYWCPVLKYCIHNLSFLVLEFCKYLVISKCKKTQKLQMVEMGYETQWSWKSRSLIVFIIHSLLKQNRLPLLISLQAIWLARSYIHNMKPQTECIEYLYKIMLNLLLMFQTL